MRKAKPIKPRGKQLRPAKWYVRKLRSLERQFERTNEKAVLSLSRIFTLTEKYQTRLELVLKNRVVIA